MNLRYCVGLLAIAWFNLSIAQFAETSTSVSIAQRNEMVQLMERLVQGSALVGIAMADLERAEATADLLRAGPYEFELSLSSVRREVTDGAFNQGYNDWAGGVSRTLRLPGKRNIDQQLAEIEVELAVAAYEKVLYEERVAFIERWSAWSNAYRLAEISKAQADEIATLAKLEKASVEEGSGRQVNADRLQAESNLAGLQADQADFDLMAAQLELETYYPDISVSSLPTAFDLPGVSIDTLLTSVTGKLPEQKQAELLTEKSSLLAQRARQDRLPDPTLGLMFSDELGGQESSITAQISIPLGGSSRRASAQQAEAQLSISTLELAAIGRASRQKTMMIENIARLSLASARDAEQAASISRDALEQYQQGYEMGAMTISELITARRAHFVVQRGFAEQRSKSEQALLNYLALSMSLTEEG